MYICIPMYIYIYTYIYMHLHIIPHETALGRIQRKALCPAGARSRLPEREREISISALQATSTKDSGRDRLGVPGMDINQLYMDGL